MTHIDYKNCATTVELVSHKRSGKLFFRSFFTSEAEWRKLLMLSHMHFLRIWNDLLKLFKWVVHARITPQKFKLPYSNANPVGIASCCGVRKQAHIVLFCEDLEKPKKLEYTVYQENQYFVKNMLLLKNPQFLPNHNEILKKWGPHFHKVS